MHKTVLLLLIALTSAVQAAPPSSDEKVNKWQDEKGVWHYGDIRTPSPDAVANAATDAYQRGDYATAFKEYSKWAGQGDPKAQTMVGLMYLRGQGVGQSQRNAIEWFRTTLSITTFAM